MKQLPVIFKRELASYFATPLAYIFLVIFLVLTGVFTFYLGGFFERGQADLGSFFAFHPWLYLFLVPAIAMRLWAEERKSGTLELLMTLPITRTEAVAGKFLGEDGNGAVDTDCEDVLDRVQVRVGAVVEDERAIATQPCQDRLAAFRVQTDLAWQRQQLNSAFEINRGGINAFGDACPLRLLTGGTFAELQVGAKAARAQRDRLTRLRIEA